MIRNWDANKSTKKNEGFTLIEVLVGSVIMATGLLLLLPMMVTSIRANNFAQNSTESSMLIKDKMEDLKNTDNPSNGVDSLNSAVRTWTISNAGANLSQMTVSVQWRDERGTLRSSTMTSYKSSR
jgi:prepilin-type N-terminal cleavage/methylation domain-containing protein